MRFFREKTAEDFIRKETSERPNRVPKKTLSTKKITAGIMPRPEFEAERHLTAKQQSVQREVRLSDHYLVFREEIDVVGVHDAAGRLRTEAEIYLEKSKEENCNLIDMHTGRTLQQVYTGYNNRSEARISQIYEYFVNVVGVSLDKNIFCRIINKLISRSLSVNDSIRMDELNFPFEDIQKALLPHINVSGESFLVTERDSVVLILSSPISWSVAYIATRDEEGRQIPLDQWKMEFVSGSQKVPADVQALIDREASRTAQKVDTSERYSLECMDDRVIRITSKVSKKEGTAIILRDLDREQIVERPHNEHELWKLRQIKDKGSCLEIVDTSDGDNPERWIQAEQTYLGDTTNRFEFDPQGNFVVYWVADKALKAKNAVNGSAGNLGVLKIFDLERKKVVKEFKGVLGDFRVERNGDIRVLDPQRREMVIWTNFNHLRSDNAEAKRIAVLEKTQDLVRSDLLAVGVVEASEERSGLAMPVQGVSEEVCQVMEDGLLVKMKPFIKLAGTLEEYKKCWPQLSLAADKMRAHLLSIQPKWALGVLDATMARILLPAQRMMAEKGNKLAIKEIRKEMKIVRRMVKKTTKNVSLLTDVQRQVDAMDGVVAYITDAAVKEEFSVFQVEMRQKTNKILVERAAEVGENVQSQMKMFEEMLAEVSTDVALDRWQEEEGSEFLKSLTRLAMECASLGSVAHVVITSAINTFHQKIRERKRQLKEVCMDIHREAAGPKKELFEAVQGSVIHFIDDLMEKTFATRAEAEQWVERSQAYKNLQISIAELSDKDESGAEKLSRSLKVGVMRAYGHFETCENVDLEADEVMIGRVAFPRWQGETMKKHEPRYELTFLQDNRTVGPGINSDDYQGNVCVRRINSAGSISIFRLFEGLENEDEWKTGSYIQRGLRVSPSYTSRAQAIEIRKKYNDWSKGVESLIRKELKEKRDKLKSIHAKLPKFQDKKDKHTPRPVRKVSEGIRKEYQEALNEYSKFCQENYISLLKRIDKVMSKPIPEEKNGRGYVPDIEDHWVMTPDTMRNLEKIAKELKMQGELNEGILNLAGHAGTGKDVLVKMFCALTGRPYFAMDLTHWTTEFELGEDVQLEAVDGATQTVKVPSVVLRAIRTPGAVMYFNEINAMKEPAFIFLHALFDEKRSMTLKTSSGKTIEAHPSVLFVSSMNPGYPGTTPPQIASRRRLVTHHVEYPSFRVNPDDPNSPFDFSEAMMIARSVDSLTDFTLEKNLNRNDFVKIWEANINNGEFARDELPKLTVEQKFDLEVIFSLLYMADLLRKDFIINFEKSRDVKKALPVRNPISLGEMRRIAYWIGQMTVEEKIKADPDDVARSLIETYFLSHNDNSGERQEIARAMKAWNSRKRF